VALGLVLVPVSLLEYDSGFSVPRLGACVRLALPAPRKAPSRICSVSRGRFRGRGRDAGDYFKL